MNVKKTPIRPPIRTPIRSPIRSGFTLVELMVSMAITAILMVGMSVFFSSTLHNMFQANEKVNEGQDAFVLNEVIRNKIIEGRIVSPVDLDDLDDEIILKNKTNNNTLPFTYIGISDENKLIMEDFLPFNDVEVNETTIYFVNSGENKIIQSPDTSVLQSKTEEKTFNNPAGMTKIDVPIPDEDIYFLSIPQENVILKCVYKEECTEFALTNKLKNPTDIDFVETDDGDKWLFVSDSGNNRILKITLNENFEKTNEAIIAEDLNCPTGLAYYEKKDAGEPPNITHQFLFIADTLNHQIKRIDLKKENESDPEYKISIIAGLGNSDNCNATAKFCKLKWPTGLAVGGDDLYISDSGNDRILKITEPGAPEDSDPWNHYPFNFHLDTKTQISKINFKFPGGTKTSEITIPEWSTDNPQNTLHKGRYTPSGSTLVYNLNTNITDSEEYCPPGDIQEGGGCASTRVFQFTVTNDEDNRIFYESDDVELQENKYEIKNGIDYDWSTIKTTSSTGSYYSGTKVTITNKFDVGDYVFYFNLKDVTSLKPGAHGVIIEIYDKTGTKIQTATTQIRVGDEVLGTDEDKMEVLVDGLNFPTGIIETSGSVIFANSLDSLNSSKKPIKNFTTSLSGIDSASLNWIDLEEIPQYDFTSDFDLAITEGLKFEKIGNILETTITTNNNTFKLDAPIPTP